MLLNPYGIVMFRQNLNNILLPFLLFVHTLALSGGGGVGVRLLMYPSPVNSLYVGRLAASPSVTSGSEGRWQHLPLVPELSPGWRSGSGSLRRGRASGS